MDITRLDANPESHPDIIHDITQPLPDDLLNRFDIVFAAHVMEHIDRNSVISVIRNISEAVKNQGELWVLVPSLEFCCGEVLAGRDSPGIQGLLFGGQEHPWDYHRCGFTLKELRFMLEISDMVIRRSYQSPFVVIINDKEYRALQNVVVGMRYVDDPSTAID